MILESCGKDWCACARADSPPGATGRIENDVFGPIAGVLRGPLESGVGVKFYFTVLDGYRGRIATLGTRAEEPIDSAVSASVDDVLGECLAKLQSSGRLSTANLIQSLIESGPPLKTIEGWSQAKMRLSGQQLRRAPSRVEQCLAIAAAAEIAPNRFEEFNRTGFFKIENYLEAAGEVSALWEAARTVLGDSNRETATTLVPQLDEGTAAAFVAEYLDLRADDEGFGELRSRLEQGPPRFVVLPFKIFGQYRAAGVWIYAGSLANESELLRHVQDMARKMGSWIEPAIEKAFLNALVLPMLEALYRFDGDENKPLITCENLRQSLFGLWFATRGRIINNNGRTVEVTFGETGALSGFAPETVSIAFDADAEGGQSEVHHLLGCRGFQLDCPMLSPEERDKAQGRLRAALAIFEASASRAADAINNRKNQERIRVQEDIRKRVQAISDEMLQAHTDLVSISAFWAAKKLPSEIEGVIVRHLNEKLLCYAVAASNLIQGRAPFRFSVCPRPEVDTTFFMNFFLSSAQLVAFSEHWRVFLGGHSHGLVLTVTFKVNGERSEFEENYLVDHTFRPNAVPSLAETSEMPWPLPRDAPRTLNAAAGLSPLMLAPMSMLRAACQTAVTTARDSERREEVGLCVELSRDAGCWSFRSTVEYVPGHDNPRFDPLSDTSLNLVGDLIPDGNFEDPSFDRETGTIRLVHELRVELSGQML